MDEYATKIRKLVTYPEKDSRFRGNDRKERTDGYKNNL